VTSKKWAFNL